MAEKKQRRQQRKRKKSASRKRSEWKGSPDLPPPFAMEQVMREIVGGGDDPRSQAQDLAYEAMEAVGSGRAREGIELAMEAVTIHPACVDALMILAMVESDTPEQLVEHLQRIVQAGEADLGKRFFKENRGEFWGLLETRPYMRARSGLAGQLAKLGRVDEAIGHYEEMLELNPNDNQGLRYVLLGQYLATDRLQDAGRLFKQYPDEGMAMFGWAKVLERYLSEDLAGAKQALAQARKSNKHVEAYLTGRKKMPKQMPDYYGMGDENEALVCMVEIGPAWARHPDAVQWLKQQR